MMAQEDPKNPTTLPVPEDDWDDIWEEETDWDDDDDDWDIDDWDDEEDDWED